MRYKSIIAGLFYSKTPNDRTTFAFDPFDMSDGICVNSIYGYDSIDGDNVDIKDVDDLVANGEIIPVSRKLDAPRRVRKPWYYIIINKSYIDDVEATFIITKKVHHHGEYDYAVETLLVFKQVKKKSDHAKIRVLSGTSKSNNSPSNAIHMCGTYMRYGDVDAYQKANGDPVQDLTYIITEQLKELAPVLQGKTIDVKSAIESAMMDMRV
jgi:glycosyltransferase involved in cell wall biosynthesis